jgi:ankyrin repeat protein
MMKISVLVLLLVFACCDAIAGDNSDIDHCEKLIDDNRISEFKRIINENPGMIRPTTKYRISLLYYSIIGNNNEVVRFLMEKGALRVESQYGNNPLCWMVWDDNIDALKSALAKSGGAYVNMIDKNTAGPSAPLHLAAYRGDVDMAALLIKNGAVLNIKNDIGETPLHYAAHDKTSNPCAILILNAARDKKKLILEEDDNGYNAFHCACKYNNIDFVKYCLDNKIIDVNTANPKNGQTALHIACYNGFTKLVDLLLKHNAKVNIKTTAGHTALHATCFWGYGTKEIIEALIKANVEINAIDNSGKTALDYAARLKGGDALVQILRQNGAKHAEELGVRVSPSRKTKPPVATGAEREGERGSTRENAGKSLNQSEHD